jgi:hypothetical protein
VPAFATFFVDASSVESTSCAERTKRAFLLRRSKGVGDVAERGDGGADAAPFRGGSMGGGPTWVYGGLATEYAELAAFVDEYGGGMPGCAEAGRTGLLTGGGRFGSNMSGGPLSGLGGSGTARPLPLLGASTRVMTPSTAFSVFCETWYALPVYSCAVSRPLRVESDVSHWTARGGGVTPSGLVDGWGATREM